MSKDNLRPSFDELERLIKNKYTAGSEKHVEFSTLKLLWHDLIEKEESSQGLSPNEEYEKRRILKLLIRLSIEVAGKSFLDLALTVRATPVVPSPDVTVLDQRIFISYATDDYEPYVQYLVKAFDKEHISYWIDRRDIPASKDWASVIDTALEECQLLVLCVTSTSLERRNVQVEWRYVMEAGKPVVPLVFEQPDHWPAHLKPVQYINATSPDDKDDAFKILIYTVKSLMK